MTDREIYLDANATSRPYPEVVARMVEVLSSAANPSSAHGAGEDARTAVEHAREHLAVLLGAFPEQITFTSGGTEANNTVLFALPDSGLPQRLLTTAVEHPSVLRAAELLSDRGVAVTLLPVDSEGRLNLEELESALQEPTGLVSVQWVNNETGVVQPVAEIAAICRSRKTAFHSDAAQAVGKLPIEIPVGMDFLTLTAHKFAGPQGVGAVVASAGARLRPLLAGGDQEHGRRAGTENVPGIVGLGEAARLRRERLSTLAPQLTELRDYLEQQLRDRLEISINGSGAPRVCNTSNVRFSSVDGQALVAQLDARGVRCSQGSACHNHRPEPSHVLTAMGLSEKDAYSSVRFSLGEETSRGDVQACVKACVEAVGAYINRMKSRVQVV